MDVFSPSKRREVMQAIRGRDTTPELLVCSIGQLLDVVHHAILVQLHDSELNSRAASARLGLPGNARRQLSLRAGLWRRLQHSVFSRSHSRQILNYVVKPFDKLRLTQRAFPDLSTHARPCQLGTASHRRGRTVRPHPIKQK